MAKRLILKLLLKQGDEAYRGTDGMIRLRADNGADFPLMLAAQLGRCSVESMIEEDADDQPEPAGLFG